MQLLGPIPSRVKLTLKLGKCEPAVMFNKLMRQGDAEQRHYWRLQSLQGTWARQGSVMGLWLSTNPAAFKPLSFSPVLLGPQELAAVLRAAVPSDPLLEFRRQLLV